MMNDKGVMNVIVKIVIVKSDLKVEVEDEARDAG